MNKTLKYGILLALLASIIIFAAIEFPKYATRIPFFAVLVLMEYYLWTEVRQRITQFGKSILKIITGVYWLPLLLFAGLIIGTILVPFKFWNNSLRTYWLGIIAVLYISKTFPIVFLIMAEIIRFIRFLIRLLQKKRIHYTTLRRSKLVFSMGLLFGSIAFIGLFVGMTKWVYDFRVKKEIVKLHDLPDAFEGMRIVQISDMHLGSWASKAPLEKAVSQIRHLKADIVFFTGDLVNYTTDEAFPFEEALAKIQAPYGVYSVLGNHDYGEYVKWKKPEDKQQNMTEMYALQKRIGWKLLNNEHAIIEKDGEKLAIIGVENWSIHPRFKKRGNLKRAIQGIDGIKTHLLLSHDPTHWEAEVREEYQDIDLTLSGHTHGMQFGIEVKNFKWSPAQHMYKFWSGMYTKDHGKSNNQYLYVNQGLGHIAYPGRIGILPEITLFELRKAY